MYTKAELNTLENRKRILNLYQQVMERMETVHIKMFPDHPDPVFLISDTYPGVWLEHTFDAVVWARLCPEMAEIARNQVNLFLDHQKEDGQLPCYIIDSSVPNGAVFEPKIGYGQLQECVSFARLSYETALICKDDGLMEKAYHQCESWAKWLQKYRMTRQKDLIELFCRFDTGHDNSVRLAGIRDDCPDLDAKNCESGELLPLLAPDINAVYFGTLTALGDMAEFLHYEVEAKKYRKQARQIRQALDRICYDPDEDFYFDAECNGNQRKYKSIAIASLFCEHLFSREEANRIFHRHMRNEQEFWTPFPFSSIAADDPAFARRKKGNDWGYYSQGLTALRTLRWMDYYGFEEEQEDLMCRWIGALADSREIHFSQELDPFTGEPTPSSQWYSSAMLFFAAAVRRILLNEKINF